MVHALTTSCAPFALASERTEAVMRKAVFSLVRRLGDPTL